MENNRDYQLALIIAEKITGTYGVSGQKRKIELIENADYLYQWLKDKERFELSPDFDVNEFKHPLNNGHDMVALKSIVGK